MDTFTDRFLHKRNAQEMIQANAAADAAKMEQLQQQMAEYDTLLQDMRRVNLKAAENMEQMQKALQEALEKIEAVKVDGNDIKTGQKELLTDMQTEQKGLLTDMQTEQKSLLSDMQAEQKALLSEMKQQIEELVPQIKAQTEESFQRSDDFLHKENVKVYRNVQAAMTEELEKQTDILTRKQQEGLKKQKPLLPVSVIIMLMVIVDIIINLFNIVIKF